MKFTSLFMAAFLFAGQAHATQLPYPTLSGLIDSQLPTNSSGTITASSLRGVLHNMLDSVPVTDAIYPAQQTASSYTYQVLDQASNYTFTATSPAITLQKPGTPASPNTISRGWWTVVTAGASATPVVTPVGATINGLSSLTIQPGTSAIISTDGANYSAIPIAGNGGGTVNGPGSSTIGHMGCWANTSGTLLSDCTITIPGTIANISGSKQNTITNCTATNPAVTLASAIDFANGQGISLEHCGATFSGSTPTLSGPTATGGEFQGPLGTTTYSYRVACVDDNGGYGVATTTQSVTNGPATLGVVLRSTSPTLSWIQVAWSTTCPAVAVWRTVGGPSQGLIAVIPATEAQSLPDTGLPVLTVPWLPASPPTVAANDRLVTTVVSGGGTTSLALAAAPSSTTTSTYVRHDDTAAIVSALSANPAVILPAGSFNIESLSLPSSVASLSGAGAGGTGITGWSVVEPVISGSAQPTGFALHDMTITPLARTSGPAIELGSTIKCELYNMTLSGWVPIYLISDNKCNIHNNYIPIWYQFAIFDVSGNGNDIGPNNTIESTQDLELGSGIIADGGSLDNVHNNRLLGTFFGIDFLNQSNSTMTGNTVYNSWREALHLSGNSDNDDVNGNTVYGSSTTIDYCISMSDDLENNVVMEQNSIRNNYLNGCGNSAIAVVAFGGANPLLAVTTITGNIIINSNLDGIANNAVIAINGSTVSQTFVNDNTWFSGSASEAWIVLETNTNGTPDHTQVGTMFGSVGTSGKTHLIGSGSSALTAGSTGQ